MARSLLGMQSLWQVVVAISAVGTQSARARYRSAVHHGCQYRDSPLEARRKLVGTESVQIRAECASYGRLRQQSGVSA